MIMNEYSYSKPVKVYDCIDMYCKIEGFDPAYLKSNRAEKNSEIPKSGNNKKARNGKKSIRAFRSMFSH